MIISSRFELIRFLVVIALIFSLNSFSEAAPQRNMCRECQIATDVDATHCPECGTPINLCLDCGTPNPANADFCIKCNAPLAEMRVLNSIDPEVRKELKLGKSERAELEKELMKIGYLLEKSPDQAEKLLFRKGKILHQMEFYSQEAMVWREYLQKFPKTSKKSFVKIYLSEALRKWGFLFYRQKNIASATELISEATETNPMNKEAWQWLGRISMENQQNDLAKEAYLKALAIEPGDKTSIHFLKKLKAEIPADLLKTKK
ncbi:MAG: zinc ribbon domain-containing protein [Candidatus Riflebacteria bacterium]